MWTNYDATPFELLRPEEQPPREPAVSTADWLVQEGPKSPRRQSMVVDPPNGRVPLKPEATKTRDSLLAQSSNVLERYGPWERCITRGVPASMMPSAYNNGHQIVQTPNYIVFHTEMIHEARVIPLDGRPHLGPAVQSWSGDSVGHWEGDTLVIDTIGLNDKTYIDNYRTPHTTQLHVVERWRLAPDAQSIEVSVYVEDPGAFTTPYRAMQRWLRRENTALPVTPCNENNDDKFNAGLVPLAEAKTPDF
jgi:hypothetical protein